MSRKRLPYAQPKPKRAESEDKKGMNLYPETHTANLPILKGGDPKEKLCVEWEKEESPG